MSKITYIPTSLDVWIVMCKFYDSNRDELNLHGVFSTKRDAYWAMIKFLLSQSDVIPDLEMKRLMAITAQSYSDSIVAFGNPYMYAEKTHIAKVKSELEGLSFDEIIEQEK